MWFKVKPKYGYIHNQYNMHALVKSKLYMELDSMRIWRSNYKAPTEFNSAKNEVYQKLLAYVRDNFDAIDDASKIKAGCIYGLCSIESCKNKLVLI